MFQAYLVAFSFYISYFVMAIPSAWILKKWVLNGVWSLGLSCYGGRSCLFYPCRIFRTFSLFLLGLFVQGTGSGGVANCCKSLHYNSWPYRECSKRIAYGVCNKFAGAIAPIVLGAVALKNVDTLVASLQNMPEIQKIEHQPLALRVVCPYVILLRLYFQFLAFGVYKSGLHEIDEANDRMNAKGRKNFKRLNMAISSAHLGKHWQCSFCWC
jgi:fucose permease